MSSRHFAPSAPTGQAISGNDHAIDHRDEFYRLGCVLLQMIIAVAQHPATASIARRVALFAKATVIPAGSGYVNARGGAALLDMTEGSFKNLAARKGAPTAKPGDELLYRLSDLVPGLSRRDVKGGAK